MLPNIFGSFNPNHLLLINLLSDAHPRHLVCARFSCFLHQWIALLWFSFSRPISGYFLSVFLIASPLRKPDATQELNVTKSTLLHTRMAPKLSNTWSVSLWIIVINLMNAIQTKRNVHHSLSFFMIKYTCG